MRHPCTCLTEMSIEYGEYEHERHTLVGSDGKSKVQKVGRVGKVCDHSRGKIKLSQILCAEIGESESAFR